MAWIQASRSDIKVGDKVRNTVTTTINDVKSQHLIVGVVQQIGQCIEALVEQIDVTPPNVEPMVPVGVTYSFDPSRYPCELWVPAREPLVDHVPDPEREQNRMLVEQRIARDLQRQICRARAEGRPLDVFCLEYELGNYLPQQRG